MPNEFEAYDPLINEDACKITKLLEARDRLSGWVDTAVIRSINAEITFLQWRIKERLKDPAVRKTLNLES